MSKELTPLEAWERIKNTPTQDIYSPTVKYFHPDCCDIVEQELKRLEKILPFPKEGDENEEYRQSVIKRLIAFEIIKEKQVYIEVLIEVDRCKLYNCYVHKKEWKLTEQEFDLLKECFNV